MKKQKQSADLGDMQTCITHLFVCNWALTHGTMGLTGKKAKLSIYVHMHTQTQSSQKNTISQHIGNEREVNDL